MKPEQFVTNVVKAYKDEKGIFSKKNAEDSLPKTATEKQKALFLFYVIQLDYATKSQRLYAGAQKLFQEKPDFFSPNLILQIGEHNLKHRLKKYLMPRYINEAVKRYVTNSKKLSTEYNSDPRLLFQKANTANQALQKVREFRGFGPKIGNFFVRTMVNTFNYNYPDVEDLLPPVDVHDVRIAYLMGYVKTDKMIEKNIKEVKKLWSRACKDAGVSWLVFDKALWLLGSEGQPQSKQDILQLIA